MLLSIIIPVYNKETVLKKCCDELRALHNGNIQFIFIDDGSIDQSAQIILSSMGDIRSENFLYVKTENHGASASRNYGLSLAQGDYLLFVDADDFIVADMIKSVLFNIPEDIDMLMFGYQIVSQSGTILNKVDGINEDLFIGDKAQLTDKHLGYLKLCCNKIIRRNIVMENNLSFNENISFSEDFMFFLDYIKYCRKIRFEGLRISF